MTPALYLLPVPLSDTPLQRVLPATNIEVVRGIKHFIVENVRSARRFIKKCDATIDIGQLNFSELNRHTDRSQIAAYLDPIEQGHPVGVISEAGCPAVADPGADVVAIAQRRGFPVVPLVGPSSILLGLMASGFNGQSFAFVGYLPIEPSARSRQLKTMEQRIAHDDQTQIFIETPYRNNTLLADLIKRLPGHLRLCVASDITGEHERIVTLSMRQWAVSGAELAKIPTLFLLYK